MKKLLSLLTLLVVAISASWGATVEFSGTSLNVSATNTSTVSPITFSIAPNGKSITFSNNTLNFGSSGVGMTISANEAKITKIEITADKNRFGDSGTNFTNTYANGVNTITLTNPAPSWSFTTTGGGINITKIVVTYTEQSVLTPVITPNVGEYTNTQEFTISTATEGASIYYTTNGATPTSSSTEYTGAFTIENSTAAFQIKAIAIKGENESFVATTGFLYISETPAKCTWDLSSITADDLSSTWWNGTVNRSQIDANTDAQALNNHGTDLCKGILFGRSGNKIDAGKLVLETGKGIRVNASNAYYKIPVETGKNYKVTYMTNSSGKSVGFSITSGATVVEKEGESLTTTITNTSDAGVVTLKATASTIVLTNTSTNTVLSKVEEAVTGPEISAENVEIAKDATTEGEIAFTVANPVTGGVVTAAKKTTADWLTLGTVANGKVPFSATANTGEERTATVTLTYTYTDGTEKTVTKDVTVTQAAPTYAITYNPGTYGEGSIEAGEKSYGVDFTLSSETFTRDEYVQTGWATVDGGEKAYDLGGTYSGNAVLELYPVWEAHATKGTSIIKATMTSKNTATVTGTIGGTATVNLQNDSYKFGAAGNYVSLTLASGTFQAGDVINIHTTTAADTDPGTLVIFGNSADDIVYNTGGKGGLGNNKFVLPAAVNGNSTISVRRTTDFNFNGYVDFIEVTRPNATITLNAKGYATYSKATDFEFAGATAYKMDLNETAKTITGTPVTGKIAAGEGILFKGEAGATVSITETTGAEALTGNDLKGTTTASGKATVPTYCYTLSGDTFKKFKGTAFNDNKAYLESTQDLSGQSFEIIFDDQPTAISFVVEDDANVAVAPVKVIKNGQLFIGNYNVAGQLVK